MILSTRKLFPTCPVPSNSSDVGDGTTWPVGVDLETACKWFYRARKWKFSYDLTLSSNSTHEDGRHTSATLSGVYPVVVENFDMPEGSAEGKMACPRHGWYSSVGLGPTPVTTLPLSWCSASLFGSLFHSDIPWMRFADDLYYPAIAISGKLVTGGGFSVNEGGFSNNVTIINLGRAATEGETEGTFTGTIEGHAFTGKAGVQVYYGREDTTVDMAWALNVTISIEEEWDFDE